MRVQSPLPAPNRFVGDAMDAAKAKLRRRMESTSQRLSEVLLCPDGYVYEEEEKAMDKFLKAWNEWFVYPRKIDWRVDES
jgi:hypothetical protein